MKAEENANVQVCNCLVGFREEGFECDLVELYASKAKARPDLVQGLPFRFKYCPDCGSLINWHDIENG